ncbi:MAG: MOSC domain-containing protein [Phycisphaerales bacterium]|nr:MOSC domain-containing protein [Planctomycetota bacterium]
MPTASILQISVSSGGVPKKPVASAAVSEQGLEGDWQNDRKHHGGPDRAVCIFPQSLIDRLRAEGHPIRPGDIGENLTLGGISPDQWAAIAPGWRLLFFGGVELEIASYCAPCSTIRNAFKDSDSRRIKQELHPGESRLYARVVRAGRLETGESLSVSPP